jgi:hypothetical protein
LSVLFALGFVTFVVGSFFQMTSYLPLWMDNLFQLLPMICAADLGSMFALAQMVNAV